MATVVRNAPRASASVARPRTLRKEFLSVLGLPAAVTAVLWFTSISAVSWIQGGAAFVLLCIAWSAYRSWKRDGTSRLPLFALVALMFWVYFALPLFWGTRVDPGMVIRIIPDSAITQAMVAAVIGVIALGAGMRTRLGYRVAFQYVRDIPMDEPEKWMYLRVLLMVGGVFEAIPGSKYIAGLTFAQVISTLDSTIPLVIFAFLFRAYLQGRATQIDRVALVLFLGTQLVIGLAGGWLGSWLDVVLVAIFTYLAERRRVPRVFVVLAVVYVIFFQAGKNDYRTLYWSGGQQGNIVQRAESWVQLSFDQWQRILSDPRQTIGPQIAAGIIERVTLLNQTSHVISLTPSVVPYQNGNTYLPVVANFVPRFIWPDKPSVNAPNQFYQVAYGLTTPAGLSQVSISSGIVAEGYMNWGWAGVIVVMFLLGILFSWIEATFLSSQSGFFYFAIGTYLVVKFLIIEGQMAQYLGGVVQIIAFASLVFLPVTYHVRQQTDSSQPNAAPEFLGSEA